MRRIEWSLGWALCGWMLSLLGGGGVGCSSLGDPECLRDGDCRAGEVCRAGLCLPGGTGDASADAGEDAGDHDGASPDAEADAASPDADVVRERNGCGGRRELVYESVGVEPGDACGAFLEGVVACASLETVVCVGESGRNACGGAGALPVVLGEVCGLCEDGLWACAENGGVVCAGAAEPNGCGGCGGLMSRPGAPCHASGGDGTWVCASRASLECRAGRVNACGGDEALTWDGVGAEPGQACDTRCGVGEGVLVCAGTGGLQCVPTARAVPVNACGGCGALAGALGQGCGVCGGGVWQCSPSGTGAAVCEGGAMVDACGGCSGVMERPGEPCGEGRSWLCDGSTLVCAAPVDEVLGNACGGTARLTAAPGDACGPCGRGRQVCKTQNLLECVGDGPGNVCGGCEVVPGRTGDACGVCGSGRLECGGTRLDCVGNRGSAARNACDGCGALEAVPDASCGTCLSWRCTSTGGLRCMADPSQAGCDELVTCDDVNCEAERRVCVESDGARGARCGECLPGFEEAGGVCGSGTPTVRTCAEAGCGVQNRECVQANAAVDATCGGCLPGFEAVGGACTSPVGVPTGVTASQGTSAAHVVVTWSAVAGASGYHVYRDGVRGTTSAVTGTTYNDGGAEAGGVPAAVTGVSATTSRTQDVVVTWSAATAPVGATSSYQVRAVVDGREGALSMGTATGFRGAQPVTGYEVRIGAGSWQSVGSALTWTDEGAPAGTLTVGTPTATTTQTDGVNLSVGAATAAPGGTRAYRVRAVNAAGAGNASVEVSGNQSVGTPSYQWQWSTTSGGTYASLSGATGTTAQDTTIAAGATRWYRVVVSAAGASSVTSSAVQGQRAAAGGTLGTVCTLDGQCPSGAWCPTNTSERRCSPRPTVGGVQMPFQWVPRGTFTMGSPEGEMGRLLEEAQVSVTLTRNYFVQRTEVTQGQWEAVMGAWNARPAGERTMSGWTDATPLFGTTPSCFGSTSETSCASGSNPNGPVERVSWWDAVVFANALSQLEGLEPCYTLSGCGTGTGVARVGGGCTGANTFCESGTFTCSAATFVGKTCTGYRLPTEAEWERAARGGTTTATHNGNLGGTDCAGSQGVLNPIAWYTCNSGGRTQAVGGKTPNGWGLYDVLGNVWEWTSTWHAGVRIGGTDPLGPSTGSSRVRRGGSWGFDATFARSANRDINAPGRRALDLGIRLVRSEP